MRIYSLEYWGRSLGWIQELWDLTLETPISQQRSWGWNADPKSSLWHLKLSSPAPSLSPKASRWAAMIFPACCATLGCHTAAGKIGPTWLGLALNRSQLPVGPVCPWKAQPDHRWSLFLFVFFLPPLLPFSLLSLLHFHLSLNFSFSLPPCLSFSSFFFFLCFCFSFFLSLSLSLPFFLFLFLFLSFLPSS